MIDKLPCLKCGHEFDQHKINIVGRYDFEEIACQAQGENYEDICGCDAGFNKVQIKKEFTNMQK